MSAFQQALKFTLGAEGGYSDNPLDTGGPTNFGITQRTWDAYRTSIKTSLTDVEGITMAEATDVYSRMYWIPARCGNMPPQLGICHFDWAVNHGVEGAARTLQRSLKVTVDGDIGPLTLSAANSGDPMLHAIDYLALRAYWYRRNVMLDPSQSVFLNGWLERVNNLRAYVAALYG